SARHGRSRPRATTKSCTSEGCRRRPMAPTRAAKPPGRSLSRARRRGSSSGWGLLSKVSGLPDKAPGLLDKPLGLLDKDPSSAPAGRCAPGLELPPIIEVGWYQVPEPRPFWESSPASRSRLSAWLAVRVSTLLISR